MIGSHNTMTYLPPKKWWMKFINWTAKCQEVDIIEQYKLGVRWFDLRVRFVDDGSNKVRNWEPEFGHGLISYKGDVFDTIKALNDIAESPVYVRVLLETSKPDDMQEACFRRFCTIIEGSYKNLQFIGGEAKYDWLNKYLFKQIYEVPIFAESYSSMNADLTKWSLSNIRKWIVWLKKRSWHLENYDEAEKEKADFVGDGFIECHADFLDFKEGNTYWLEYIGDDKYNVRSDNLLGRTYHITPCQLYTVFKKLTWLEKQGNIDKTSYEEGVNAPTAYGKYIDECLNDAVKHFFSEGEDNYSVADLFYAGVRCGQSCLEKQSKSQKEVLEDSKVLKRNTNVLNDIFPKRWAKKHNALAREQYTNIILDYVNI